MKNLNKFFGFTFIFTAASIIFIHPVSAQTEKYPEDETVQGGMYLESSDVQHLEFDNQEYSPFTKSKLNTLVSFNISNGTLRDVLVKLSDLSKLRMIYNDDLVKSNIASYEVKNQTVEAVLNDILKIRGIDYIVSGKDQILIGKKIRIDEETGTIQGIVKDKTGDPLVGANVMIKENKFGAATNKYGKYFIPKLKPGTYTVEVSYIGFNKESKVVLVKAGEITVANFTLESSAFYIGAIEVVGTTELIPKDANTKTVITGAEIEHFQATSIRDVLDLVPGIQKTSNPGLSKTSQVAIRGDQTDQLSALGTLIMVDGIPLSNNANLQFEKWAAAITGPSNVGGGVDLRTIPADNIESIEIITGLPSVRYGDVTAGIINVKTKIGPQPYRLKIKNNPDTREANFGGGSVLGLTGFSYNLNAARSERDIRKDGDEYTRFTGQTVFSRDFWDNTLSTNIKLNAQMIYDEEQPKGDVQKTKNYNRGYTLGYSMWGKYVPYLGVSSLDYNAFITYRRENSMRSRLVQSDLRILPSGDTISTYLGKVETRGNEWTIGGRLEWNKIYLTGDFIHRVMIGSNIQYDANTGEGVLFDTLFSYYGVESGKLPFSFDDIPGQVLVSIYAEDKITGKLGVDFTATVGFRYEMYRPYDFNLKGLWGDGDLIKSHQGTFFNPRLNLMFYLSDYNQIRLSAGYTTKSPSMSVIYPALTVRKWRNPVEKQTIFFRPDRRAPELKGYREGQIELSYDHKFFNMIGTTINAYYKKRTNDPVGQSYPIFYALTDSLKTSVYYIDYYSIYENLGWTDSKGIELTLRTGTIKPLNMEFQVVGSYNYIKRSSSVWSYDSNPDLTLGRYPNYKVPNAPIDTMIGFVYGASGKWDDRFIMNYYLKYTVAPLGLWVTLRAEHVLFEKYQEYNLKPIDFSVITDSVKLKTVTLTRQFDEAIKTKPVKWLFNLNISKSLFEGAEISFYVNNFIDNAAVYRYYYTPTEEREEERNPKLFYGIEFSMVLDKLFK